jgi:hypothetical protein
MSEENVYTVRESEKTIEFRRQLLEEARRIARKICDERMALEQSSPHLPAKESVPDDLRG